MRPGQLIGARFEVEAVIGAGGMGTVYRARDRLTHQRVAVKLMHGQAELDRKRFLREALALERVAHPAIVGYRGHGETPEGFLYLAMEWLEGHDLFERLGGERPTVDEVIALGQRVAEALAVLHEGGVVHRDLKPSNLFLEGGSMSHVKLLDLGIARLSATRFDVTQMTAPGVLVGTPSYVSPEQARGRTVDARTDLYSLGVVLWECLTHQRAFPGQEVMAVLARVLFDPLPPLEERVAGLPTALSELVATMTAKEPSARPAGAREVAEQLAALRVPDPERRVTRGRLSILTPLEMRVVTAVVASPPDAGDVASDATWLPRDAQAPLERARPLAERYAMRVESFPDGTLIALVDGSRHPTDGAIRAARFARALHGGGLAPEVVVCTDRVVADKLPVGEAVERAAELLAKGRPEDIRIDEATGELLRGLFEVTPVDGGLALGPERSGAEARPAPTHECLGRGREVALIHATVAECAEERCARAILIVGDAGLGKTRLVDEALEGVHALTIRGRGDPVRLGSPYAVLSDAAQALLGIEGATSLADARAAILARVSDRFGPDAPRVAAMLGELAGVPFDEASAPGLDALREDPRLIGDLVRASFVEYVAALAEARPLLFVIDDVQWADRSSVELIDATLRALEGAPITVLALGRPEVRVRFPRLFEGRDVTQLELSPLSRRATERLASLVSPALGPEAVAQVADRAQGNPFFAEELARAAARGEPLPRTVIASVQVRLDALEPPARLVLRAASVIGRRFPRAAIEALVGTRGGVDVSGWLDALVQVGMIDRVPSGGLVDREEHVFRHGLVRDVCYETLTPEDRRRGHRNAARWLEAEEDADPSIVAFHLETAGERVAASGYHLAAAERAFRAGDLAAALGHAERVAEEAPDAARARAWLLEGEVRIWRAERARAREVAEAALARLEVGSADWIDAVGVLLDAAGGDGDPRGIEDPVEALLALDPPEPEARRHLAAGLARVCTPLLFLDRSDLAARAANRAAKVAVALGPMGPMLSARLAENRAMAALGGADVVSAVEAFEASAGFYAQAGAARWAASQRVNLASKLLELGDGARAAREVAEAIAYADAAGEAYTSAFGRLVRGLALQLDGQLEAARDAQSEAARRLAALGDARLESASRSALAECLAGLGRHDEATAEARRAVELVADLVAPRAAALAVQARLALERGDAARGLALAEEAKVLADVEPMLDRELYLAWVHAWALAAVGRVDESKARASRAWATVNANAARIEDDATRRAFLQRVPEHRGLGDLLG